MVFTADRKSVTLVGLTTNSVYGTRVQDKEICLNVPDVLRVLAVYESSTAGDPNLPRISLINRSAELTDTIQGEIVVGETSGATAKVVSKLAGSVAPSLLISLA